MSSHKPPETEGLHKLMQSRHAPAATEEIGDCSSASGPQHPVAGAGPRRIPEAGRIRNVRSHDDGADEVEWDEIIEDEAIESTSPEILGYEVVLIRRAEASTVYIEGGISVHTGRLTMMQ